MCVDPSRSPSCLSSAWETQSYRQSLICSSFWATSILFAGVALPLAGVLSAAALVKTRSTLLKLACPQDFPAFSLCCHFPSVLLHRMGFSSLTFRLPQIYVRTVGCSPTEGLTAASVMGSSTSLLVELRLGFCRTWPELRSVSSCGKPPHLAGTKSLLSPDAVVEPGVMVGSLGALSLRNLSHLSVTGPHLCLGEGGAVLQAACLKSVRNT